jgi:hypothetical protein
VMDLPHHHRNWTMAECRSVNFAGMHEGSMGRTSMSYWILVVTARRPFATCWKQAVVAKPSPLGSSPGYRTEGGSGFRLGV